MVNKHFIPFVFNPAGTAFGGMHPQHAAIHCKYSKIAFEGSGSICKQKSIMLNTIASADPGSEAKDTFLYLNATLIIKLDFSNIGMYI